MRIPDHKREQISRLVAQGENLDPLDMEVFYRWINSSYKALGFHPSRQRTFDEYCRSSSDSNPMRVYVGVWILKLSLGESSSYSGDSQDP